MVGSGQYIAMSGQQAVTIPVVGSVQGHIPSIGHVVQVRLYTCMKMYIVRATRIGALSPMPVLVARKRPPHKTVVQMCWENQHA